MLLRFVFLLLLWVSSLGADQSIPLPRQTVYVPHGFAGGMGLGSVGRHNCKDMAIWQVQGDFFYTPTLSAGPNMVLYGGNADDQTSITYQRYYLQAKFHRKHDRYSLFLGPMLGFDNTNLQELRRELEGGVEEIGDGEEVNCAETYGTQGMSLGYEAGLGVLLGQDWGATLGHSFALTTGQDAQFALSLGLAFNVWNYWARLRETLLGAWVVLEWRSDLTLDSQSPLNSYVLGVSLGI